MKILRYGNTNTFYIPGTERGLLIDTDYAGTLPGFFRAAKEAGISTKDIAYVLATHYHPDHIGIIGDLQALGITLLLADVQMGSVHFSDGIFSREKHLRFTPIDVKSAKVISCAESRWFLQSIGIAGEIIHTPSHSDDSMTVILDNGDCFAGDLEPRGYLDAYEENPGLEKDWENVMSHDPKRIFYAHARSEIL